MRLANFRKLPNVLSERTARKLLFALFIAFASFFFGKAIVYNNIRLAIIAFLFFILGVACLKIWTGILALLVFLPFMAHIRRYIYAFNPYVSQDPILLISDVMALFMFSYIFLFHRDYIAKQFRHNEIVRYVSFFLLVCTVQILNPLQGSLFIGFSGLKYFIVPLLWFYFGLFISKERINTIAYTIIIIGVIVSLYGMRQAFVGFTSWEEYWIRLGGYGSLNVGGWMRPVSTLASGQEYVTFVMIAAFIAAVYLMKGYIYLIPFIGLFIWSLILGASRGAIFGLALGAFAYIILGLKNVKTIIFSMITVFIITGFVLNRIEYIPTGSPFHMGRTEAFTRHMVSGLADPFAKSSTSWYKIRDLRYATIEMLKNPMGYGLGAGTLGVMKFGGTYKQPESGMGCIMIATGVLGFGLFCAVIYFILRKAFSLYTRKNSFFARWIFAFTLLILTSIIDIRLYSIGPLVWLLWGMFAGVKSTDI